MSRKGDEKETKKESEGQRTGILIRKERERQSKREAEPEGYTHSLPLASSLYMYPENISRVRDKVRGRSSGRGEERLRCREAKRSEAHRGIKKLREVERYRGT